MVAVTLPQLSLSMEEGKVVRWLVPDGEHVAVGQPIVEIETDKATIEVEAPADGVLRIVAQEGQILAVETTLAEITGGAEAPRPVVEPAAPPPPAVKPSAPRERDGHVASPAARRIAAERGIDLASATGSGPGGRIIARDLETALPVGTVPVMAGTVPAMAGTVPEGLREAVVANITASWQQIPHIHIGGELVADGLAEARRDAPPEATVTDLLILAVAAALADVPELNGRSERVDLSLAVATGGGVVAPVLRDVGSLGLAEIARERGRLVAAARAGTVDRRDLAGGTFTLSNLGAYPVDFFAPVVSGPQIAMLATGRLAEKPVAIDGMLAVRHRLWANVAIDHRGADGETGARFLAAFERRLAELPARIRSEGAR
jgi:pyruvate dehydrogenase E2 component (dihydrolipoamide acetyltransferase)